MPSGKRLEGKVAIVTGAGTRGEIPGTGQAAAILMAREGAKILLSDIDINNAEETLSVIKKEGGGGKIFIGDVTSEKDCESMINEAVAIIKIAKISHLILCFFFEIIANQG